MAYSLVRLKITAGLRDKFVDVEDDSDFQARVYPELDEYLSLMESRGWSVVDTAASVDGVYMYVTLHRPESFADDPA